MTDILIILTIIIIDFIYRGLKHTYIYRWYIHVSPVKGNPEPADKGKYPPPIAPGFIHAVPLTVEDNIWFAVPGELLASLMAAWASMSLLNFIYCILLSYLRNKNSNSICWCCRE